MLYIILCNVILKSGHFHSSWDVCMISLIHKNKLRSVILLPRIILVRVARASLNWVQMGC